MSQVLSEVLVAPKKTKGAEVMFYSILAFLIHEFPKVLNTENIVS